MEGLRCGILRFDPIFMLGISNKQKSLFWSFCWNFSWVQSLNLGVVVIRQSFLKLRIGWKSAGGLQYRSLEQRSQTWRQSKLLRHSRTLLHNDHHSSTGSWERWSLSRLRAVNRRGIPYISEQAISSSRCIVLTRADGRSARKLSYLASVSSLKPSFTNIALWVYPH